MTFRILGLDPGGTTGWATFTAESRWSAQEGTTYSKVRWDCGQLADDKHLHHKELDDLLGFMQTDHFIVVCESFEYRNRARAGLELISKEYIGVLNLFYQERMQPLGKSQQVYYQTASMGKITQNSFVKKRHLQKLGLWSPGLGHAMDGYGHILYWMIHTGDVLRQELLEKGWK